MFPVGKEHAVVALVSLGACCRRVWGSLRLAAQFLASKAPRAALQKLLARQKQQNNKSLTLKVLFSIHMECVAVLQGC